jgi:hypothetical protein
MQKGFDLWRKRNLQKNVMRKLINMMESKKTFDLNFAFSMIQKKRFAILKKSIADKIEGCEFSYNYLLDENKHIKEILDKKQHELEKSKFVNLLRKIIRNEKEIKLKYFYKFMKNGYKFWKFRKTVQRTDKLIEKKLKIVFTWILKVNMTEKLLEQRVEYVCVKKEDKINR